MSGPGRVCSIHNEWCPDGGCRWCEPLTEGFEWRENLYGSKPAAGTVIALDVWRSEAIRIAPASMERLIAEAMDKIASAE